MIEFLINQIFDANLLVAMFIAALAGLISFFSPCVIPLVPGYLSYASGMSDVKSRSRVFLGSVLFVLGFTFLFVSYGILFGELGSKISENSRLISIALGCLTIALGLIFLLNEKFYRSFKPAWRMRSGLISAPLLGFAFGIGWTPCIGPTLGAVQVLAIQSATAMTGALVFPEVTSGITDASTTLNPSTPFTLSENGETTASSSTPILQVPQG